MSAAPGAAATAGGRGLRSGDVVEIDCTDLIAKTGQAVGRADGMVVYVLGPVPGERARVRVDAVKAKYAVADLIALLDRSPDRVEPFCRVFGTCGGCQVQHLAYPAQLLWKKRLVENALRRIGGIAGARVGLPVGMAEPRAYRNKMALVVDRKAGEPAFGFYAARTHDVVPVETCPVVMPQLDGYIGGLWAAARAPESGAAFEGARHVIARAGQASGQGVLSVTTDRPSPGLAACGAALAAHLPGIVGIGNSYEPPSENAVMGRRSNVVYGSAEMEEAIEGVRFRVSPASFFQVNSEIVGKIFTYLRPQLRHARRLIDLYCGAGTFALYFAKNGARVVGIEENPNAVREARANAALNDVDERTLFIAGRVDATLRSKVGVEALGAADVVFLDPPRKGSDEATLDLLVKARVPHVWYLSCNPATLARDLAQLVRGGYTLDAVQPFDMFPQTGHIEALASLHRAGLAPLGFQILGEET
ncbi:MAG: 23S rRNA (uracil(1939)-C(5))-methyltransferase RlmD [Candidatus Baltobacteraceae bacterium]|jgi:23S rRNA (uracil1939-C5)-methyltransferase